MCVLKMLQWCVVLCKPNKLYTLRNVMSLANIFGIRNYDAFSPLDTSCENNTSVTVFLVVCGFPKCREGEVPPLLFYHPHNKELLQNKELLL